MVWVATSTYYCVSPHQYRHFIMIVRSLLSSNLNEILYSPNSFTGILLSPLLVGFHRNPFYVSFAPSGTFLQNNMQIFFLLSYLTQTYAELLLLQQLVTNIFSTPQKPRQNENKKIFSPTASKISTTHLSAPLFRGCFTRTEILNFPSAI